MKPRRIEGEHAPAEGPAAESIRRENRVQVVGSGSSAKAERFTRAKISQIVHFAGKLPAMNRFFLVMSLLMVGLSPRLKAADAPPNSVYETIVQQYMTGKWDELETTLKTNLKEITALAGQPKLDVTYIKASLLESRPAWWAQTKAGKKVNIRASAWGRFMDLTFDPSIKNSVETKSNGMRTDVFVNWPTADMDSTTHAEHGFTKGELSNLSIFSTIGMAGAWSSLPTSALMNLTEKDKSLLFRGMDFRGNVTGIYYGSPRARQWGIWLYLHSYEAKYAKMSAVNTRRAIAAACMAEILSNSKRYPSIKLPASLDADSAEEKLALAMQKGIEKTGWTLAEDRSLREAIKTFATANEAVVKTGGLIKLANGLTVQLDPEADAALRTKRDAWFKKQFEAVKVP